jgi:hypothetical protein
MSKTTPGAERTPGSRLWRGVAIVVVAACLVAGLLWFFADPLRLPTEVLEVLDQRAGVVGMFTGMAIGVAGLVIAVVALRAQVRADHAQPAGGAAPDAPAAEPETTPQVSASGERSVAIGGDNSGIVSTGDGARNVQLRAAASGQGRVYQAARDQVINRTVLPAGACNPVWGTSCPLNL